MLGVFKNDTAIDHMLVVPKMVKCRDITLYLGAIPLLEMCVRAESMCPRDNLNMNTHRIIVIIAKKCEGRSKHAPLDE